MSIEVWTLAVDGPDSSTIHTSVHATEAALWTHLRESENLEDFEHLSDDDLLEWLTNSGYSIYMDSHRIDLAPPLFTYADLSTGHLPQTEMDTITLAPVTVWEHEYGAWVNVPPAEFEGDDDEWDESNLPNLRKVIAWARERGARWINFDRDGDTVPDLPTWEW